MLQLTDTISYYGIWGNSEPNWERVGGEWIISLPMLFVYQDKYDELVATIWAFKDGETLPRLIYTSQPDNLEIREILIQSSSQLIQYEPVLHPRKKRRDALKWTFAHIETA